MIGDGMSDMGGSAPRQDDLEVNVQPIIDAVPEMSIERIAKAFEYPDPYVGYGEPRWTNGPHGSVFGAEWADPVGDIEAMYDRLTPHGPPVKPTEGYPMDSIRSMTSEATSLADKPVTIVLDLDAARARRGTTNQNARGNAADRARRRAWLVETYRADQDVQMVDPFGTPTMLGIGAPACRCYRCGTLLTVDTVTVDRIIPGCRGGTYRRNNIRPACSSCNSITGSTTRKR